MANNSNYYALFEMFHMSTSRRRMVKGLMGGMFMLGLTGCTQQPTGTDDNTPPSLPAPVATKTVSPQKDGIGKKIATYTGHTQLVNDIAWSPDSKMVATASDDKTVQVWEALSGKTLLTYKGHTGKVASVSWSPDGQHIVSGGDFQEGGNKTIQVWEALSGKFVLGYAEDTNDVKVVRYSHNGRFVVSSGADVTVRIWQASDGTTLRSFPGGEPGSTMLAMAWSPDDDIVAYVSNQDTNFYTHASNDKVVAFKGHDKTPIGLDWSPNGMYLVSVSPDDTIRIWKKDDGSQVKSYDNVNVPTPFVTWSPDGETIASTGEGNSIRLWDPLSGQNRYVYMGHSSPPSVIAWSPGSTHIASASADMSVQVWQTRKA